MGKGRKLLQLGKGQAKISSFFGKKTQLGLAVSASNKINTDKSPYFQVTASPEVIDLSDDDFQPSKSKISPTKEKSLSVCETSTISPTKEESLSVCDTDDNLPATGKKCDLKDSSPIKGETSNLEDNSPKGDLTPKEALFKRKSYDSESSPDIIPATPTSQRTRLPNKSKKQLKLNKLRSRQSSNKSPFKKLKYCETENVDPEVNVKCSLQSRMQIEPISNGQEQLSDRRIIDFDLGDTGKLDKHEILTDHAISQTSSLLRTKVTESSSELIDWCSPTEDHSEKGSEFSSVRTEGKVSVGLNNELSDNQSQYLSCDMKSAQRIFESKKTKCSYLNKSINKIDLIDANNKAKEKQCSDIVTDYQATEMKDTPDKDLNNKLEGVKKKSDVNSFTAETETNSKLNKSKQQDASSNVKLTMINQRPTNNEIKRKPSVDTIKVADETKIMETDSLEKQSETDIGCCLGLLNSNQSELNGACNGPPREKDLGHITATTATSDCISLDDWDISAMMEKSSNDGEGLNLETLQHCEVVHIENGNNKWERMVTFRSTKVRETACCRVGGFWTNTNLSVGDIVSVKAGRCEDSWLLDNSTGLLVHHPDTLISSTAVVGSLFCPRRGVLSEWFRGIDGDSRIMVIGSLVHELLQEVLERKLSTESAVHSLVQELLNRADSIQMLYSSRMSRQETVAELEEFVPRIVRFVQRYVKGSSPLEPGNFRGSICAIQDIEENIWEPRLGIKGKVDVTVEVKIHNRKKVMPLELKTGRSSFSAEHRGQVTLYTMMMTQLGKKVDSGLLLYLRDGTMQEISAGHNEWRDLMILRNELAHFVTRIPAIGDDGSTFKPPQLPEPISHHSACGKCPYLTLCSSFLRHDGLAAVSSKNPLSSLATASTSHLSNAHMDYLIHWTGLLLLEESESIGSVQVKDMWCLSPEQREKRGRCLTGMILNGKVVMSGDTFLHSLQKSQEDTDLRASGLSLGDYVVVSTDKRLALATGIVRDLTYSSVTLSLSKNLSQCSSDSRFHIDTYTSQTTKVFNLTNVGCLMDDTDAAAKLRKLVIDKEQPTFMERLRSSIMHPGRAILEPLNMGQRRAVVKALTAHDYMLIKGMPGTGKTATIVSLVELLVKLGQSVLVTSHTHSAVDNVLLKLAARGVDLLRLGSSSRIHPQLADNSEQNLTSGCTTPEQLETVYNSKLVVGTTCLGAGHPLFSRRAFDVCIVDESTQVLQVSVLRPLFSAKKFILIGDPEQLPPVVRNKRAREMGMSESLFARLDSPVSTVCLEFQYRMNQAITDLANALTYNGQLKCGSETVSLSTLKLTAQQNLENKLKEEPWLHKILSCSMDHSVVMLDTGNTKFKLQGDSSFTLLLQGISNDERGCTNICEAAVIHYIITELIRGGVPGSGIGIIAPYRAQVALLRKVVTWDDVEVNTVDQYQGRDKDIIIFSCTKTGKNDPARNKEYEILNDKRRLTVAITRAKHKLLVIADVATLQVYLPFKQLFDCLSLESKFVLSDGANGFHWDNVLKDTENACSSQL